MPLNETHRKIAGQYKLEMKKRKSLTKKFQVSLMLTEREKRM